MIAKIWDCVNSHCKKARSFSRQDQRPRRRRLAGAKPLTAVLRQGWEPCEIGSTLALRFPAIHRVVVCEHGSHGTPVLVLNMLLGSLAPAALAALSGYRRKREDAIAPMIGDHKAPSTDGRRNQAIVQNPYDAVGTRSVNERYFNG